MARIKFWKYVHVCFEQFWPSIQHNVIDKSSFYYEYLVNSCLLLCLKNRRPKLVKCE